MLDGSGSIRGHRFDIFKAFLKDVVHSLEIHENAGQIGLLVFADDNQIEFNLNTYRSTEDVMHAIDMVNFPAGRTNIADALMRVKDVMFTPENGDREDVRNTILILTDGVSTLKSEDTLPTAAKCRLEGIHILVASAETDADNIELRGIASRPFSNTFFPVDRFSDIPALKEQVVDALCNGRKLFPKQYQLLIYISFTDINECDSNPCQAGGRCIDELYMYRCICRDPYTGVNCERRQYFHMNLTISLHTLRTCRVYGISRSRLHL
jgi:collagen type VI alpha